MSCVFATSVCRHHGADSLHLCPRCWDSRKRLCHVSHQISSVSANSPNDPDGPTWRNLEAAGVGGLCPQQGNLTCSISFHLLCSSFSYLRFILQLYEELELRHVTCVSLSLVKNANVCWLFQGQHTHNSSSEGKITSREEELAFQWVSSAGSLV